ncbi:hypothetical protein QI7_1886 [Clostridioides difficile 6042]|nr:hypothetical protein QI7_1886 [Clostridioides difficile 6042]
MIIYSIFNVLHKFQFVILFYVPILAHTLFLFYLFLNVDNIVYHFLILIKML